MNKPLINAKARQEFRAYFVDKTLREISEAFDAGGGRWDGSDIGNLPI